MIDPVTIGLCVGVAVAITFAFKGGQWATHRTMLQDPDGKATYKDKLLHAEKRIERLDIDLENNKRWAAQWKEAAETHAAEREKLKAIAATQEVKWPEPPKPKVATRDVWDGRRYSDHPSENLKALATDLAQFKGREVSIVLTLSFTGGWAKVIQNKQMGQNQFNKLCFEGPPERVMAEITTFMTDHDMPFMSPVDPHRDKHYHAKRKLDDTQLKWNDLDSGMVWRINLSVTETVQPAPKPEIHIVQVPVVETRTVEIEKVVERVVEKHTADPEQLAALIEVAVDERLAARAHSRAPASEEDRKRRAAQSLKTTG